ncbi:MAG: hypothetical protein IT449_12720 [Phycisphaerales bacterium]|nr:hypothetical protein [Phycisphaerales bacterium]
MGLFETILGRRRKISRDDSPFGRIEYTNGIWTHIPDSSGPNILITIVASPLGPSMLQATLFANIKLQLAELLDASRDLVKKHIQTPADVARMDLYSLEIGTDEEVKAQRFVLELADTDAIVIHRVSFEAGKAVAYSYDS